MRWALPERASFFPAGIRGVRLIESYIGHFEIYEAKPSGKAAAREADFLTRHLSVR
jgi:hypothetical protein